LAINRLEKRNGTWQPRPWITSFRGKPFGWDFNLQRFAGTSWYVDNTASGLNNGTSWTNAWETFADIVWGGVGIVAGDTLYISGGPAGQTYGETLTISVSGSVGNIITITPGTDSGYNGTVTVDGGGARTWAIRDAGYDYITINGFTVIGVVHATNGAIEASNASYVTIKYNTITNDKSRGVQIYNCDHSIVEHNDIRSGDISNSYQTDGIYAKLGDNNEIRYNYVLIGNNGDSHNDPIQTDWEEDLKVYGNYSCHVVGRGGSADQGMLIADPVGYNLIYNNVIRGGIQTQWQALLLQDPDTAGGTFHAYNNIVIAQEPTFGYAFRVHNSVTNSQIYAKNNICYSPAYYAMCIDNGASPTSRVDYNQLWSGHATLVAYDGGGKTWAQWQAAGYDANGQNVDPSSEWDTGNEYRPNIGATSIDNGTDMSAYFTIDRDEVTRPINGVWDIGPYEYGAGSSNKLVLILKS